MFGCKENGTCYDMHTVINKVQPLRNTLWEGQQLCCGGCCSRERYSVVTKKRLHCTRIQIQEVRIEMRRIKKSTEMSIGY